MSALLTLSIVSHGHTTLLQTLLADLVQLDRLTGVRVIVTLNLADEPFDARQWESLDIDVRRNAVPQGFGANHNAAFATCTTPWFAILNPDLRLAGGNPFTVLIATASRIDRIGVIAPRVVGTSGLAEDAVRDNLTPWSLAERRLFGRRLPVNDTAPARQGRPFYWLAGMCLLFDANAFAAVRGFDESFFLYGEDYDLCARLYGAGYALAVEPTVSVVHDARRDSHRSFRHLRWHLSSLLRVWCSRAFWSIVLNRWPDRVDPRVD